MKKWYDEEYEWEIEVIGFLRGSTTEGYCRNGEEIGDKYKCTYGCPVNDAGQGICSKVMLTIFPIMEAVRSGGDLENTGLYDGKEISQIYLGKVQKLPQEPLYELKAFTKTFINAQSKQTIRITLTEAAFMFYHLESHSYQVLNGDYIVYLGKNANDIVYSQTITFNYK